jgi:hypothetical protein
MKKPIGTFCLLFLVTVSLLAGSCRKKCGECREYCTYSSPDTSYTYTLDIGGGALYACDKDLEDLGYETSTYYDPTTQSTRTCTPSCR